MTDFAASTEVLDASGRTHRGLLSYDDFAAYETKLEAPVGLDYHGYQVYKCGPWCQGPVFLQQLALLEGFDLAKLGQHLLVAVVVAAGQRREQSAVPMA